MDAATISAWTQDLGAKTDTWTRETDYRTYCRISQYEGSDRYCWQAVRGDHRLADIVTGRAAAMAQADATMALLPDEFNARVTTDLMESLRNIERQLLDLNPTSTLLPGYHTGFEAGFAHAKRLIGEALDSGSGQS
jgi:hypothetical protein